MSRILITLLLLLTVATPARADEAPEPDSMQAHCTREEQCPSGIRCATGVGVNPNVDHAELVRLQGEIRACAERAAAKGLTSRCGTKAWTLYCPADERGSWTDPKSPAGRTKQFVKIAVVAGAIALGGVFFAVWRARTRRRAVKAG